MLEEEIFGPVAPIATFRTEDEALEMANDTEFGLVAYLFTQDIGRAFRVMEGLETGMIGFNQGMVSNAGAPFGGVKQSGYGREGGAEGIAGVPRDEVRRDERRRRAGHALSDEPTIRRGTQADAEPAADLYVRARRAGGGGGTIPPLPHGEQDARRWFLKVVTTKRELWVAEDGAELVAILVLDGAAIDQLYVEPGLEGRGVGAALVEHAKRLHPSGLGLGPSSRTPARCASTNGTAFAPSNRPNGSGNMERSPDGAWPGPDRTRDAAGIRSRHADASSTSRRRSSPSPAETPEPLRTELDFSRPRGGRGDGRGDARRAAAAAPRRRGLGGRGVPAARHAQHDARRRAVALQLDDRRRAARRRSTSCRSSGSSPPAWCLDFTTKADGDAVTGRGDRRRARRAGRDIQPLDIVLIRTGRDAFLDAPDYMITGPA